MKCSIHQYIRGKPIGVEGLNGDKWMESNRQRVNLGYDWVNIDAEWADIFQLITQDGIATSAELVNSNRRDDNYVSRQLFMVDIDAGMTLEQLQDTVFYQLYGAGYYTTPSHQIFAPRFRIMFVTETPILDRVWARLLMIGLMRMYDHADPVCKDSTRIFYGTVMAAHSERTDRVIPDTLVAEIIAKELEFLEQRTVTTVDRNYEPATTDEVVNLLTELKRHYTELAYEQRRDVTWALLAAGVATADAVALMRSRWPDGALNGKYEAFTRDHKRTAITLGTVYHMIRQHNNNYGRAESARDQHYLKYIEYLRRRNENNIKN